MSNQSPRPGLTQTRRTAAGAPQFDLAQLEALAHLRAALRALAATRRELARAERAQHVSPRELEALKLRQSSRSLDVAAARAGLDTLLLPSEDA